MAANDFNYASIFEGTIDEIFKAGLLSSALSIPSDRVRFVRGNTVMVPRITTGGYGEHSRNGGWNRTDVKNEWQALTLKHDRDVEFFVDAMDVDETNETVAAAKVTGAFVREHAIPELDSYRFSKIHSEFVDHGGEPDTTALTADNVLETWDKYIRDLKNSEVQARSAICYATPDFTLLLKQAKGLSRNFNVQGDGNTVNREVLNLDGITINEVPPDRMQTAYDFTSGFAPSASAKQINMILIHPSAVIAPVKYSEINFFAPGTHTQGSGYLYQNRMYTDLFILQNKVKGIKINVKA